jgi:hypothetical protein
MFTLRYEPNLRQRFENDSSPEDRHIFCNIFQLPQDNLPWEASFRRYRLYNGRLINSKIQWSNINKSQRCV